MTRDKTDEIIDIYWFQDIENIYTLELLLTIKITVFLITSRLKNYGNELHLSTA